MDGDVPAAARPLARAIQGDHAGRVAGELRKLGYRVD